MEPTRYSVTIVSGGASPGIHKIKGLVLILYRYPRVNTVSRAGHIDNLVSPKYLIVVPQMSWCDNSNMMAPRRSNTSGSSTGTRTLVPSQYFMVAYCYPSVSTVAPCVNRVYLVGSTGSWVSLKYLGVAPLLTWCHYCQLCRLYWYPRVPLVPRNTLMTLTYAYQWSYHELL